MAPSHLLSGQSFRVVTDRAPLHCTATTINRHSFTTLRSRIACVTFTPLTVRKSQPLSVQEVQQHKHHVAGSTRFRPARSHFSARPREQRKSNTQQRAKSSDTEIAPDPLSTPQSGPSKSGPVESAPEIGVAVRSETASPWRNQFDFDWSPDLYAIVLVYFVQGVLGLSRLAVSFFLKDELQVSPAQLQLLTGASTLPWLIKPIWGFISDTVPLFGYRRRSYLVLCSLFGAAGWGGMALAVSGPRGALAALLLGSLSTAFSDVVVDSIVVERARGEAQGKSGSLQSLCWGSAAVGGIVSAYFSGSLVQDYGPRYVFGLTALLPILTATAAVLVQEERVASPSWDSGQGQQGEAGAGDGGGGAVWEQLKGQMGRLKDAATQRSIWVPTVFMFLWQATPNAESAMFYFTTEELGFNAEFLGRVKLVTSLASLGGIALYNGALKDVPLKKMFLWTSVVGTALGLTQLLLVTGANRTLGIDDQFFLLGDSLILTVMGQLAFMPVLVLAAKICPEGVEATLFAALMSVFNAGGVSSGILGSWLTDYLGVTSTDFTNLALLVLICNLSSLAPLPFLNLLDEIEESPPSPDSAKALGEGED